jgi:alpha-ketoglutarate-dependent taurine dioxygenase
VNKIENKTRNKIFAVERKRSSLGFIAPKIGTCTVAELKIGIEVTGIYLNGQIDKNTISQIKDAVTKHRLIVFRNQGNISGERMLQIAKWFGKIQTPAMEPHPKSPSP